jgi:hypothetical protein
MTITLLPDRSLMAHFSSVSHSKRLFGLLSMRRAAIMYRIASNSSEEVSLSNQLANDIQVVISELRARPTVDLIVVG